MPTTDLDELKAKTFSRYHDLKLGKLLSQIREPGRYQSPKGVNSLVNAELSDAYDFDLSLRELRIANKAKSNVKGYQSILEHRRQGISLGLNPYTDWSIRQFSGTPSNWYVVVALDYYSIGHLEANKWQRLIEDPFFEYDAYWFKLWRWILGGYKADSPLYRVPLNKITKPGFRNIASDYIRRSGAGFLFHNLIPYLRFPNELPSGTDWPDVELQDDTILSNCTEDLRLLRSELPGQVTFICTRSDVMRALMKVPNIETVICLSNHPSHRSFGSKFCKKNELWFPHAPWEGNIKDSKILTFSR